MIKPNLRVLAVTDATCPDHYAGSETTSKKIDLRVWNPDREVVSTSEQSNSDSVCVKLKDLMPILRSAAMKDMAWLRDFEDDTMIVSRDLYDVAIAYEQMRRSA